jgi:hypothetical protein
MRLLRLLGAFLKQERRWWELYEVVRETAGFRARVGRKCVYIGTPFTVTKRSEIVLIT